MDDAFAEAGGEVTAAGTRGVKSIIIEAGTFLDRAVGCMLGGAIGDALGTTLEFQERDRYKHITGICGGGVLKREPGGWTDDTAMAIALATSLVECGVLDERDFLDRLRRWLYHGDYSCVGRCDDVGHLTRMAITNFSQTGNIRAGRTDKMAAGNGSIVRMAPIAILYSQNMPAMLDAAERQSRCTHGAREAIDACLAFGTLLVEALDGGGRKVLEPRQFNGVSTVARILAGAWQGRERRTISSGGHVVSTLQAAMWAVGSTASFGEAVLLAANLGEDADTTAAVTGQLAGAIYGIGAIPEPFKRPIAWSDCIVGLASQLASMSGSNRAAGPVPSV